MLSSKPVQCPKSLLKTAAANPPVLTAVVNAGSRLVLESTLLAVENGLIEPVLIGDHSAITKVAKDLNWDVSALRIVAAADEIEAAQIAVSLARHKEVASLMKGDIHTDNLLRAVLNVDTGIRSAPRLSHVFHMSVPESEQALCITDAVVNVQPDVTTKLEIARNATTLMHALGISKPNIAVLSATEVATPAMPSSVEAAEVVSEAAAGAVPGAVLGGPFAFDNAISASAAKLKGITDPVAGHADVLLVPNIETGNALFKQMVYFMSAAAAGVVLGASVPITLTSRADPAQARLASTALASIYAAHTKSLS